MKGGSGRQAEQRRQDAPAYMDETHSWALQTGCRTQISTIGRAPHQARPELWVDLVGQGDVGHRPERQDHHLPRMF